MRETFNNINECEDSAILRPIISTVTISVKEYKELITETVENRKDAEFEKQNRWKLESEIKALKEEIVRLSNENKKFINEIAKLEVEIANYKEVCKNVCS